MLCFPSVIPCLYVHTFLARDGRTSGQGSPLGAEQVPSPQSPLSSTGLAKNEATQVPSGSVCTETVHVTWCADCHSQYIFKKCYIFLTGFAANSTLCLLMTVNGFEKTLPVLPVSLSLMNRMGTNPSPYCCFPGHGLSLDLVKISTPVSLKIKMRSNMMPWVSQGKGISRNSICCFLDILNEVVGLSNLTAAFREVDRLVKCRVLFLYFYCIHFSVLLKMPISFLFSRFVQSRRVNHISAEQKRRSHINVGFKTLCTLVPTLKSQSNANVIELFIWISSVADTIHFPLGMDGGTTWGTVIQFSGKHGWLASGKCVM